MCGRYRLTHSYEELSECFATQGEVAVTPRYNIAPSQPVFVIRQQGGRRLSTLRWGLIPSWAKDASIGFKTINARAETVATTPSFREPFKLQRCLIPADGFYEWKKNGKAKQPYCFEMTDGKLFAFAGLWDRWIDSRGETVESCTILTTTPNALLADVHDRMPVILRPDDYDLWLNPKSGDSEVALSILRPYDAGLMRRYPVSTRVNHVQNDDAECAKTVELELPPQANLFLG
jgi:putative SOS response-associated peptidase YedK